MTLVGNGYAVVVLATVLLAYGLNVLATLLDLRRLRGAPPARLEKVFDDHRLGQVRAYARARAQLGLCSQSISTIAFLGFWTLGGFGRLAELIGRLDWGPVLNGALYAACLGVVVGLLAIPFDLYSTFVIEERFGFNRTTWKTWVLDRLKAGALALVIGGPILLAVIWLFETLGTGAWWRVWIALSVVSFSLQLITPTWILPLFHRFEPLRAGSLREALLDYANRVGFALRDVFVIDGSRRTSKANAFFVGLGKNRRVALFDTLVEKHDTSELVAVLAHEVGHYKRRHLALGFVLGIAHTGALLLVLSWFLERAGLFAAFGVLTPSTGVGLVLFGLLMQPIDLLLGVAFAALSRLHEYQADRYAIATTGNPAALARALEKLSADSLSNPSPSRLAVLLGYSHPPLLDRLVAIDAQTAGGPALPLR